MQYQGEFLKDIREGFGVSHYSQRNNQDIYRGEFRNDQMNGRGVYLFNSDKKKDQNSLYYVGEFKQGVAQGSGRMVLKDGTAYNGSFVHNQLHCDAAVIQYGNGDQYDGEVEQGKKNGTGTYIYRNGDKYIGPFKNDVKYTNIEEGETGL